MDESRPSHSACLLSYIDFAQQSRGKARTCDEQRMICDKCPVVAQFQTNPASLDLRQSLDVRQSSIVFLFAIKPIRATKPIRNIGIRRKTCDSSQDWRFVARFATNPHPR